jgi:aconitate hydratase
MNYKSKGIPLIVIAGKEYGSGSSRDWAAKGPALLGVRAVIAESFERIHRSNLIGMGILPLEFEAGVTRESLALTGEESFNIEGISGGLQPKRKLNVSARGKSGEKKCSVVCRIDTPAELSYFQHGGILPYVLNK